MAAQVAAFAGLSGSAATGVGVWLGVVAAEDPVIGDRYGVSSKGQAHSHFLFPFPFPFPHPVGIRFGDAFLRSCSFSCFPTHQLHNHSRIDKGELPGVAA